MQNLFQLLQFFGICGLVVPVLQDWRTLALACVSPWRGGGGALQASGLQLHPSTLAMYLFYTLQAQTCTIFHSWSCSISSHLQFTSPRFLYKLVQYCDILSNLAAMYCLYVLHELYIKPFSQETFFVANVCSACVAMWKFFRLPMLNISHWRIFLCLVFLLLPCWQCVVS